jgi:hypothetical protein
VKTKRKKSPLDAFSVKQITALLTYWGICDSAWLWYKRQIKKTKSVSKIWRAVPNEDWSIFVVERATMDARCQRPKESLKWDMGDRSVSDLMIVLYASPINRLSSSQLAEISRMVFDEKHVAELLRLAIAHMKLDKECEEIAERANRADQNQS